MTSLIQRLVPRAVLALSTLAALAASSPAHAAPVTYTASLLGVNESPANASPGVGTAVVETDAVAHTMHVHVEFDGLIGNTTASHIHAATVVAGTGTAGVATTTPTFAGFPLGVTSGTYDIVLDMTMTSSYNPAYVTAHGGTTVQAEFDLFQGISAGKAYLNVHSSAFPGGEIRGFLEPVAVPVQGTSWSGVKALYR